VIPFDFEHDFRTPSVDAYWRCYFDPDHVARLDEALGLRGRELLERQEDDDTLVRRFHVVPARQIPGWLRKVAGGGLDYEERSTFYKADDRIEIEILPSLLAKRTRIAGTYTVVPVGDGVVRRRWCGEVDVRAPVIGGRVERAVVSDMEKSYAIAVPMTQDCLDHSSV
jgi:hypothetical protein